jgi:lipid-A-disaccharide synthase
MRYYLIAGEASGDLHGSNLMQGLKEKDPQAEFRFWGGDMMQAVGGTLVKHYKYHAVMGGYEVLVKLPSIFRNMKECKQDILQYKPDALILIDYPGFNLRIAKFAKLQGIKVIYYISPKVWVWKKSRVEVIKKFVDHMMVIFPFEPEFYQQHQYKADYVGNPLMDAIEPQYSAKISFEEFILRNKLNNKPVIALLAGSRKQEIDQLLPYMLSVIPFFSEYQFVIAGASSIDRSYYEQYIGDANVSLVFNQTYDVLQQSTAAVVTSGTATLETALLNIPQVVIYRTNPLTFFIGRPFVPVKYFSLPNIIMGREIVKELLQHNLGADIKTELGRLLNDATYRNIMLENYAKLQEKVGRSGASKRAAALVLQYIQNK